MCSIFSGSWRGSLNSHLPLFDPSGMYYGSAYLCFVLDLFLQFPRLKKTFRMDLLRFLGEAKTSLIKLFKMLKPAIRSPHPQLPCLLSLRSLVQKSHSPSCKFVISGGNGSKWFIWLGQPALSEKRTSPVAATESRLANTLPRDFTKGDWAATTPRWHIAKTSSGRPSIAQPS
jgi:hypothetical protein